VKIAESTAPADPLLLADAHEEDQTRTYSADTIDRLLSGADGGPASKTPIVSVAADEDVTRIYSSPPVALIEAEKSSLKRNANDDITRTFDSPLDALKHEREVTSPGRRSPGEALVIIAPEPKAHGKKRYVALGLVVVMAAIGLGYRVPIAKQARTLVALVARGVDSTRAGQAIVSEQQAVAVQVNISISVSPADARLSLDGVAVPNPFVVKRTPDTTPHELVAEASGYQSLKRMVRFERDLTVMLGLAALPASTPAVTATAQPAEASTQSATPQAATPSVPATQSAAAARPQMARARKAAAPESGDSAATVSDTPEPAAKKAICSPPYNIDDQGIKVFKPECL
jgi:serine/threonine-protein kinase